MEDYQERIRKLDALYKELMDEYQSMVLPYGIGHDMPEEVRKEASEVFNHAYAVLTELRKLSNDYEPNTESNAVRTTFYKHLN